MNDRVKHFRRALCFIPFHYRLWSCAAVLENLRTAFSLEVSQIFNSINRKQRASCTIYKYSDPSHLSDGLCIECALRGQFSLEKIRKCKQAKCGFVIASFWPARDDVIR